MIVSCQGFCYIKDIRIYIVIWIINNNVDTKITRSQKNIVALKNLAPLRTYLRLSLRECSTPDRKVPPSAFEIYSPKPFFFCQPPLSPGGGERGWGGWGWGWVLCVNWMYFEKSEGNIPYLFQHKHFVKKRITLCSKQRLMQLVNIEWDKKEFNSIISLQNICRTRDEIYKIATSNLVTFGGLKDTSFK